MKVLLFAAARQIAGAETVDVVLSADATVADLRANLGRRFPELAPLLAKSAVAVNQDFAEDSRVLGASDEVAVIPPVSGG